MAASALRKRQRDPAKIQLIGRVGSARSMAVEYKTKGKDAPGIGSKSDWGREII